MQTTYSNFGIFGTIANWLLGNDIKETENILKALKEQANFVKTYTVDKDKNKSGSKGHKSDNRLQELQEINQTLEKINKEYDDLSKKEGKSKALADIKKQFNDTLNYTNKLGKKFGLHFDYPTEFKSLQQYRREILKVMKSLKNLKGGEKTILEFETMIGKADSDDLQKQIEQQLKEIAERISRAKVADEFYRKILSVTGDYSLAGQVAESIFGQDGRKLNSVLAEQVRSMTNGLKLPNGIISPDNIINYKKLREWAEVNKEELDKHLADLEDAKERDPRQVLRGLSQRSGESQDLCRQARGACPHHSRENPRNRRAGQSRQLYQRTGRGIEARLHGARDTRGGKARMGCVQGYAHICADVRGSRARVYLHAHGDEKPPHRTERLMGQCT